MYCSLAGLAAIGIFLWWRQETPRTAFWESQFWRGAMGTILLVACFFAMNELPLATVITLNYPSPVWLILLSALLLKERFNRRLVFAGLSLPFYPALLASACCCSPPLPAIRHGPA